MDHEGTELGWYVYVPSPSLVCLVRYVIPRNAFIHVKMQWLFRLVTMFCRHLSNKYVVHLALVQTRPPSCAYHACVYRYEIIDKASLIIHCRSN